MSTIIDGDPKKVSTYKFGEKSYNFYYIGNKPDGKIYDQDVAKQYIDNGDFEGYAKYMSDYAVTDENGSLTNATDYYYLVDEAKKNLCAERFIKDRLTEGEFEGKRFIDCINSYGDVNEVAVPSDGGKPNATALWYLQYKQQLGYGEDVVRFSFPKRQRGKGIFDWMLKDNDYTINRALDSLKNAGIDISELYSDKNIRIQDNKDGSGFIQIPKNSKYFDKVAVNIPESLITSFDRSMTIQGIDSKGNIIDKTYEHDIFNSRDRKEQNDVSYVDALIDDIIPDINKDIMHPYNNVRDRKGNHNKMVELYNNAKENYDVATTSSGVKVLHSSISMGNVTDELIKAAESGSNIDNVDKLKSSALNVLSLSDNNNSSIKVRITGAGKTFNEDFNKYRTVISSLKNDPAFKNYLRMRFETQSSNQAANYNIVLGLTYNSGYSYLTITLPPMTKTKDDESLAKLCDVDHIDENLDVDPIIIYIGETNDGQQNLLIKDLANKLMEEPKNYTGIQDALMKENGLMLYDEFSNKIYYYENGNYYYKYTNNDSGAKHETTASDVKKFAGRNKQIQDFTRYIIDNCTTGVGGKITRDASDLDNVLKAEAYRIVAASGRFGNLNNIKLDDIFSEEERELDTTSRILYNEVKDNYNRIKYNINKILGKDNKIN